jgi:hypothetical protein
MPKRSHIIVLSGSILLISGIIISQLLLMTLHRNAMIEPTSIGAKENISKLFGVNNIDRNISLYLHATNTTELSYTIKDPNGNGITASNLRIPPWIEHNITEIYVLTFFKPNIIGKHNLTIHNSNSTSISVDGAIGTIPSIIYDLDSRKVLNNDNLDIYIEITLGSILIIVGIILFILGIISLLINGSTTVNSNKMLI